MSTEENPYLNRSTESHERTQRHQQRTEVDPHVEDALRELDAGQAELREKLEEIAVEKNELQNLLDAQESLVEELQEAKAELRKDVTELHSRIDDRERDLTCSSCGSEFDVEHVDSVAQERDKARLTGSSRQGLVTAVQCPSCTERVDVQGRDDQEDLTDDLRRAGVARGEPSERPSTDGEARSEDHDIEDDMED